MSKKYLLRYLPPVLGILVLAGVIAGLHGVLRHIGPGDVVAALRATPRAKIFHAALLLAGSVCIMLAYDVPGILFARRLPEFPRLAIRRIGFASFCAYALSHVLGAPALSAAAIRVRLYAQWDVPAVGIARIIAISGSMFTIGISSLLSLVLLLHPWDLPLFGHAVPDLMLRAIGAVLAGLIAFYVVAARRRSGLKFFRWNVALPGARVALAQVLLAGLDIAVACGIFYAVLPAVPGLYYPAVLGVYLAAFAGGMFSGLPGGVGVFDSLLLLELSDYMAPAPALGAILLFRVLYFLAPATAAALCYAGHEVSLRLQRR